MILEVFRASDGTACYLRRWPAAGRPRARLVVWPGIRSHGGWYGRSSAAWAEVGYEVVVLDRRGAGLNTARRGDTPSFRRLLDDAAEFLLQERRTRSWLPTVAVGVSWGAKLALGLTRRKPGLLDAVAFVAPGFCPKVRPNAATRLRILAARIVRPTRLFDIPLNAPELFTASPGWQRFLADNPHDLRQATARFLVNSALLDVYLRPAARRLRIPVLTLLAGRDRIIDNAATRRFVARFPSRDNRVIDYPAAGHTLEFEGEGCGFVADVATWAGRRV